MKQSDTYLTHEQIREINAGLRDGYAKRKRNFLITGGAVLVGVLLVLVLTRQPNLAVAFAIFELLAIGAVPYLNRPITEVQAHTAAFVNLRTAVQGYYLRARSMPKRAMAPLFDGLGWFKREEHVIGFELDEIPAESFIYTYRHPFENRYDRKKLRVTALSFAGYNKQMPHVLMRSKASGVLGKLDEHIPMTERVRVESEFEKHFDVYTHRRTATDALAILAPNVLAAIMDYGYDFDIEFVGSTVYIYSDFDTFNGAQAERELLFASKLVTALKRKLQNYRLVLPSEAYPFMTSQHGTGTLHLGDMRLSGGLVFLAGYIVFAGIKIWAKWESSVPAARYGMIGVAALSAIAISIFLIFMNRKRDTKRTEDGDSTIPKRT